MNAPPAPARRSARRRSTGVSLVELMVGLVIALVISLVMFNVFVVAEGQRRTTASGGDAQQSGSLASYLLERTLRMGGAGLARVGRGSQDTPALPIWGCMLKATQKIGSSPVVRIPLQTSSMDAPFASLGLSDLAAAPALIFNGGTISDDQASSQTPDAIMVMAGTHRSINIGIDLAGPGNATSIPVKSSAGFQTGDLFLAAEGDSDAPMANTCWIVQTTSEVETSVTAVNYLQSKDDLGKRLKISDGQFTPSTGLAPPGGAYTNTTRLADLGTVPLFAIFGIATVSGQAQELRRYDILTGSTQSVGDGVVNLQAIYGIASALTSQAVSEWVAPVGDWSARNLMDGSAVSRERLGRIRAIHYTMVTRSAILERSDIEQSALTMFAYNADRKFDLTLTGNDRKYRYRVFEQIVPLRNMLIANDPS